MPNDRNLEISRSEAVSSASRKTVGLHIKMGQQIPVSRTASWPPVTSSRIHSSLKSSYIPDCHLRYRPSLPNSIIPLTTSSPLLDISSLFKLHFHPTLSSFQVSYSKVAPFPWRKLKHMPPFTCSQIPPCWTSPENLPTSSSGTIAFDLNSGMTRSPYARRGMTCHSSSHSIIATS